jgi:hypothetical protein
MEIKNCKEVDIILVHLSNVSFVTMNTIHDSSVKAVEKWSSTELVKAILLRNSRHFEC